MEPVDKTSAFTNLGLTLPKGDTKDSNQLGQDQFLELMLAQLSHQDPLKPMENGDFLAQMAQFSTVTGIHELQASVDKLSASLQSNQALQASALVGRSVMVPTDRGILEEGEALTGAIDLPASTSAISLTISDPSGQVVRRLQLGSQAAGMVQFAWDGITDGGQNANPGTYKVAAEAFIDGEPTALSTLMSAKVESVSLGQGRSQDLVLNVAGMGPMKLSDVAQIN